MRTLAVAILSAACAAFGQKAAFEVASVKRAQPITPALVKSGRLQMGVSIDSRNVRISQYSLYELILLAYQVKGHQISCPEWTVTERYDIQAKLPEGARRGQVPEMLQTLLAERFGMRVHREKREVKVYALRVADGGPHLKVAAPAEGPAAPGDAPIRGGMTVGAGGAAVTASVSGQSSITPGADGNVHVENRRTTMAGFASSLNRYCDQPVIDMTGIEGAYDMEYDVSAEEVRNAARSHGIVVGAPAAAATGEAVEPAAVSLAASLRRLGLKLESRKTPVEVIVVDKVEKEPTEN